MTPISAEGLEHLSSGAPVIKQLCTQESGDTTIEVHLRMLLGSDMTHIAKLMRQDPADVPIAQMVMHIAAIVPTGGEPISKFDRIRDFYSKQEWRFHEELEDAINDFGGGTDTSVEMDCRRCNAEQEGMLPFGAEFFYPRKSTRPSSLAIL